MPLLKTACPETSSRAKQKRFGLMPFRGCNSNGYNPFSHTGTGPLNTGHLGSLALGIDIDAFMSDAKIVFDAQSVAPGEQRNNGEEHYEFPGMHRMIQEFHEERVNYNEVS